MVIFVPSRVCPAPSPEDLGWRPSALKQTRTVSESPERTVADLSPTEKEQEYSVQRSIVPVSSLSLTKAEGKERETGKRLEPEDRRRAHSWKGSDGMEETCPPSIVSDLCPFTEYSDPHRSLERRRISIQWVEIDAPKYKPSPPNLKAQAKAYQAAGDQLLHFLEACRGQSWEKQLSISSMQLARIQETSWLILQAAYYTDNLRSCPVEWEGRTDRYDQWVESIEAIINRFNQLSSPPPSKSFKLLDRVTSDKALGAYTTASLGIWGYLINLQVIVVSTFASLTIPFLASMLALLVSIGKACLKYIQMQKKESDRFLKEDVLTPLIELFEQHRFTEEEVRQMDFLFPAVDSAARKLDQTARKLDQMDNELGHIKNLLTSQQTSQPPQAPTSRNEAPAGGASKISLEEWRQLKSEFGAKASTFQSALEGIQFLNTEQRNQILRSLTNTRAEYYSVFLSEQLVPECIERFSLNTDQSLQLTLTLSGEAGTLYWNSLKEFKWQIKLANPKFTDEKINEKIQNQINKAISQVHSSESSDIILKSVYN